MGQKRTNHREGIETDSPARQFLSGYPCQKGTNPREGIELYRSDGSLRSNLDDVGRERILVRGLKHFNMAEFSKVLDIIQSEENESP